MKRSVFRLACVFLLLVTLFTGCNPTPPLTSPTYHPADELPEDSSFAVHFIDVGQADAALVLCDGAAMLIDGGNVADSDILYTYLKKHNVKNLAFVVGTHAHEDHIGGLAGALEYANAAMVLCPVTEYDSTAFKNFSKAAKEACGSIQVPQAGDTFTLGSAQGTILAVNTEEDTNNTSIVLRLVYGETSFLFAADAETAVEQAILNKGLEIRSTVLKVGHHGSDSSTGYQWLRQIAPQYAVISVGKDNTYGHPTETVLSRLRDADVTTYRTDLQGDIICTSDGKTVSFTVSRNESSDPFAGIGPNSTQPAKQYILNTNSKKFHLPGCSGAANISAANREEYQGSRQDLLEEGYSPCGICDP